MGEIKVKEKDIVVPGQVLAVGMDFLPSYMTYRLGEDIRAQCIGVVNIDGKVLRLLPLSGRYFPKRGDTIVAQVMDILISGWRLDINSAYSAVLSLKDASERYIEKGTDLTRFYALGDFVICKITNVTSQKLVDVTMRGPGLRALKGGRVIEASTNKVPRIIGKQGSMVTMIKDATGCKIVVGQNGIVWLEGAPDKEVIAVNAIKKIEEEAHTAGLTDRMKEYLEKLVGKFEHKPENTETSTEENAGEYGEQREYREHRDFREHRGYGGGGHSGGRGGGYGGGYGGHSGGQRRY